MAARLMLGPHYNTYTVVTDGENVQRPRGNVLDRPLVIKVPHAHLPRIKHHTVLNYGPESMIPTFRLSNLSGFLKNKCNFRSKQI